MADCESLPHCHFFNNRQICETPGLVDLLKARFCHGDNSECARYIIAQRLGEEKVPKDLFPSHSVRAEEILRDEAA